ncbi:hypothetical protein Q0812_01985 [Brevundimonas sp. 2R-24]|uniref:Transposase n=1 Tax=Peiella sedimenti TaxID=3061083 RepID=A0ABT8SJG5_9CAUL|nr:hypothetical protein [Caulobacteraceae bacterium XZ-24]
MRTSYAEWKYRTEDTWLAVRRAWEDGETAASCARRFDVGLANLWRRRAAENWRRRREPDPVPEPVEGWDRWARERLEEWEVHRDDVRRLAVDLLTALEAETVEDCSAWHLGWIYRQRARRLGPEAAARDREAAKGRPWADAFWDEDGRLHHLSWLDNQTLMLWRDECRKALGLPEGAAPSVPIPPDPTEAEWERALELRERSMLLEVSKREG